MHRPCGWRSTTHGSRARRAFCSRAIPVSAPPWPNEVVDLIRALPNAQVIRGNNDDMYVFPHDDSGQYEVGRWYRSELTDANRQWLHDLPAELAFDCGGVTIRMAHSSEAFVGKTLHAHYRTSSLTRLYPDGPVTHERLLDDFRRRMTAGTAFMAQIDHLDKGGMSSDTTTSSAMAISVGGCWSIPAAAATRWTAANAAPPTPWTLKPELFVL